MDRLDAIRAFLAVADRGSFAQAARALRLSSTAATRAVASLEDELGLALFSRTTRSVRLTERGALYAERCRRILADLDEAQSLVRGEDSAPRGLLAITAPVFFGRLHVLPIVEILMRDHEVLTVRLTLVDRIVHLIEEGFDIAVRIGTLADSSLIATQVSEVKRVLVASPNYLKRNGTPMHPSELKAHRIISFEGLGSTDEWRFGTGSKLSVKVAPRLSINCAEAAIDAASRHQGIVRLLSYQVEAAVRKGELRRLLPSFEPPPVPVNLLYQANRRGSPNVVAFIQAARRYFALGAAF